MIRYILTTGIIVLGVILEIFLFPLLICMVFFPTVNYWIIFTVLWGVYIMFSLFSFFVIKRGEFKKHET